MSEMITFYCSSNIINMQKCNGEYLGKINGKHLIGTEGHCFSSTKIEGAIIIHTFITNKDKLGIYRLDEQSFAEKEKITSPFPVKGTKVHIRIIRNEGNYYNAKRMISNLKVVGKYCIRDIVGFLLPYDGTLQPGDSGGTCVNEKGETLGRVRGVIQLDQASGYPSGLYIYCSR